MPGISGNYYTLAIGKQTAKGTPQTTPTFKLKVTGGDIEPVRAEIQLAETDASRQQGKSIVVGAHIAGTPEFYVRPDDYGLLAYALLGANADAGTAPNYLHDATMANSGPYLTIYKAIGGSSLVDRYQDCRIDSMRVRGQAGQALSCAVGILGLDAAFGQTDPVLAAVTQDPLVYPQVTVTKAGSAPGTVESFDLSIANNAATIQADTKIQPYDVVWGQLDISGTFTLLFESDADYRKYHAGSAAGTSISQALFTESLSILAQVNANLSVKWTINSVAYTAYPVPPDPAGAPIRVAVGFRAMPDATVANYLTIRCSNSVPSY